MARSIKGRGVIDFVVEPEAKVYPMVPPGGSNTEMVHDPRLAADEEAN